MEVDLICSTDSEALGCSFKSPAEHNYNMLRGAAYEEGRIQQKEMNLKDCALRITRVRQSDNGDWKCNVTAKDANGEYDIYCGWKDSTHCCHSTCGSFYENGQKIYHWTY